MKANFDQANKRIVEAASKHSRDPSRIRLMAVSKFHPAGKVADLAALGQTYFGENYAQELIDKSVELSALPITWSFIGQLQSNKIKKIVLHADEIQSVAKLKDAQLIERYVCEKECDHYPIYLCINAADEPQKRGASMQEARELAAQIEDQCPHLTLKGVMAIPPPLASLEICPETQIPHLYSRLRKLADSVGQGLLSLGMSQDLEAAIAAGSDIVRLGTALFGERPKNKPI
ncbi:MAG: YggS family pyridoxal phosphate-dependent enzyme [Oligoflexales bacterium]|nr:YggS family pyridoxal phosphate-dependent enzyme [Oligoflexales bacterium]